MTSALTTASATFRSRSLREYSDIAFPHFFRQVLGGAPCQRDDRHGRVLVGIADEGPSVGHEQVLHLVRLAVAVQNAGLRVVAHAHGADLVNDGPAARN